MLARGLTAPVLVGGAAVELYTNGAIATGDFDIATGWQTEFESELVTLGFERPRGAGKATRGWMHADFALGFEVVSGSLLDGQADRSMVRVLDLGDDGTAAVLSVEDMIADRMGQYASGTAGDMRDQARHLFVLHSDMDRAYLDRRIRYESSGDYGIGDLEGPR